MASYACTIIFKVVDPLTFINPFTIYILMVSIKAVIVEDKADLRSKNKIKKGEGWEECLCKESIRSCEVLVNEWMWQSVKTMFYIIKIIFVSKLAKCFFVFCFLGKISFSSLNYHKSSFFVPKVSKVLFSSLNFSKRTDFHPSVYFC